MRRRALALAAAAVAGASVAGPASADDSAPVRVTITAPATARLDKPLTVAVKVDADAGAVDYPDGPLRVRVKLAPECGGDFAGTQGPAIVDAALPAQPVAGQAFSSSVSGTARPRAYGVQAVCVFVESTNDQRQYVTDVDTMVDVSQPCTVYARRVTSAKATLKAAKKALTSARARQKRAKTSSSRKAAARLVSSRRKAAVKAQHSVTSRTALAQKTCGPGVAL